jgi:hypothetical protein
MESARPGQRVDHDVGLSARKRSGNSPDASNQLRRRPAREGQQEDSAWICTARDEMSDSMRQSIGLATTRAGNDEQRLRGAFRGNAVFHGLALLLVERDFIEGEAALETWRIGS